MKKTIDRLNAFAAAGADCVFAPGLKDKAQISAVQAAVNTPLNILAGRPGFHLTRKELGDMGVARVSIGSALARVAYYAFTHAAEDVKDGGAFGSFERADDAIDFTSFMRGHA